MRFDYPMRVKTGIVLVLLAALYAGGMVVTAAARKKARRGDRPDGFTRYERRFDALRAELSPDSVVGYVTDQKLNPADHYLITQYALAPVIVRRTVKEDRVVGNFHDPTRMGEIARKEGLVLIRDYGNGVALFRGKGE